MDELLIYVREAVDRKSANMRRQKRRDVLRLQLVKIFDLIADKGTFALRLAIFVSDLIPTFQ